MKAMTKISTAVMGFIAVLMLCLVQTVAFANGPDVNVKIEKKGGDWYAQPWVWIVGGAVFLLLLVALLRGGKRD